MVTTALASTKSNLVELQDIVYWFSSVQYDSIIFSAAIGINLVPLK